MKRLVLVCTLVLAFLSTSTACQIVIVPPPPPPPRPPPPLATLPASIPPYTGSGPRVAVLGDSITWYTKDRTKTALETAGYATSITGNPGHTFGTIQPWGGLYWDATPEILVVNLGTNDAARQAAGDPNYTLALLQARVRDYQNGFPESCVVFTTTAEHQWNSPVKREYNEFLRTLPHVADWDAIVRDHLEYLPDGIHPFDDIAGGLAGNIAYANMVTEAVRACPQPDGPFAANDTYQIPFDTTLDLPAPGVLADDVGTATVTSSTPALRGTATVAPDGSLTYQPTPGFSGGDLFTYTITDAEGRTSTATVIISVQGPLPPPG